MEKIRNILLLLLFVSDIYAEHNRAGEITYRQISAYTFEFTVTTFCSNIGAAGTKDVTYRTELDVEWGDNTSSTVKRTDSIYLFDNYIKNTYVSQHTFPGPGIYQVLMQDPNRNPGIKNMDNSLVTVFAIKTTIMVNPQLGANNTPVLLNYPLDKAVKGRKFIHNPAAFDIDGDSVSYSLGTCLELRGLPIQSYSIPKASNTPIYIDKITGDLVWDAPMEVGKFNIAINVEEWRYGIKIGNIIRDMQIEVFESDNNPPVNDTLKSICVEAGKPINLEFSSTDADNDLITITASGGPFEVKESPASFNQTTKEPGLSRSVFTWQTSCSHVRNQPYFVVIKSEDNYYPIRLTDFDNLSIKVIAPGPKNVNALSNDNSILISWDKSICAGASGYEIYRSNEKKDFVIDSCNGGIPENSGYTRIATVNGINTLTYTDGIDGNSLSLGNNYCYRIVAIFPDGARSYPSEKACTVLLSGLPALTNASVTKVDATEGKVFISWIKPLIPDTIVTSGPFEYRISRTNNFAGTDLKLIHTRESSDLNDTTYTDTLVNTIQFPYNYKVELFNNEPGKNYLIGRAETASTFYPLPVPGDNQLTLRFMKNVPWLNLKYVIYRQNPITLGFDSIGQTLTEEYIDKGLANGVTYYYRVKAYGDRLSDEKTYKVINWSHINGGTPIDTFPPCAPYFRATSLCDSFYNQLKWEKQTLPCSNDIIKYKIYHKKTLDGPYQLIDSIENNSSVTDTFIYIHKPEEHLAGCYVVTAVDSFNNESRINNKFEVCLNECMGYKLPNVFTPNGDNKNDLMVATNKNGYVKTVDMKIFNRWGKLVYKTNDPYINWDGKDMTSKQYVSPGIYYYICDVYIPGIAGVFINQIPGFVYVFYNEREKPSLE